MRFEISINKEPSKLYLCRSYDKMLSIAYNKLREWVHENGQLDTVVSVYDCEKDKTFFVNRSCLQF